MAKPDGGPAFPTDSRESPNYDGMSLRDYFAAQALAGVARLTDDFVGLSPEVIARMAYSIADALLTERDK